MSKIKKRGDTKYCKDVEERELSFAAGGCSKEFHFGEEFGKFS